MPAAFTPSRGTSFVASLLDWFATVMRPFPWRKTYAPYDVWISEIMLQQTQAGRGALYFETWMRRFPDIQSVALADEEAILASWEGLGYYSRARNLQSAARRIMSEHGGGFPRCIDDIRALPGIGEYTAAAIAAIAFNLPEPAVDANVIRIFARICDLDMPSGDKRMRILITDTVRALMRLDAARPRLLAQALMELGALVCGKKPKCPECPVGKYCKALKRGTIAERPLPSKKARPQYLEMATAIVARDNRYFIRKRPADGLWGGLWEFPGGPLLPDETPEDAAVRIATEATRLRIAAPSAIASVRHSYTTRRVTMHGYLCEATGKTPGKSEKGNWVNRKELAHYAFPAGQRKLLERLGWKNESGKK